MQPFTHYNLCCRNPDDTRRKFSIDSLKSKFGEATGIWLHDICRGICHEPVTETSIPKSMMAAKSLRPAIKSLAQLSHWLEILSSELYNRLIDDNAMYNRWPKTITFHMKSSRDASSHSRRTDLPPLQDFVASSIRDRCLALWTEGADSNRWPVERIAVGVGGFVYEEKGMVSVTSFFKKVEPGEQAPPAGGAQGTAAGAALAKPVESPQKVLPAKGNTLRNFFASAPATADSRPTPPPPATRQSRTSARPLDAFFQSALPASPTRPSESDARDAPRTSAAEDCASNDSGPPVFRCETCPPETAPTFLTLRELDEHADWHYAKDLQEGDRVQQRPATVAGPSSLPSSGARRSGNKRKRKESSGPQRSLFFGPREPG